MTATPSRARLAPVVEASSRVAAASGRNDKVAIIAQLLREAGPEAGLAATYLSGDVPQDRLEVGWATIRGLEVAPAADASLTLVQVDTALEALAAAGGPGSRGVRLEVLAELFAAATEQEQSFLSHLLLGELRHGALEGVVTKAIAVAAEVPEAVVRRALMLSADLGRIASVALDGGREALEAITLTVGQGVQPMLASTSASVSAAVTDMGTAVVEWKLDGARIQVHKDGADVRVLTRNLNDVTVRSGDVVAVTRGLPADRLILDGEVLAMGADGRPEAFQDTMSAFSDGAAEGRVPMSPFFFDVLHVDGEDLIDEPLTVRRQRLEQLVGAPNRIPSRVVTAPEEGDAVLAEALEHGHEGVMVKSLDGTYAAGRRGKTWRKVKPVITLDLVVLAVEWGSGRRQGLLSNIHLGARDDREGADGFVMLGKTFKGMTDAVLAWQTERFLELETHREGHVVHVRPEQVAEIAIDGIQVSRRYPGGIALRFARLVRYRDDKDAGQADTLSAVEAIAGRGAGTSSEPS